MATRVRKLARELGRTTADVLGLLHELGYVRYRSPEDMVADNAIERVREAARQGVRAAPVKPPRETARQRPQRTDQPRGPASDDWMARLVPGVVPRSREEHELRRGGAARSAPVQQPQARPQPQAVARSEGEPAPPPSAEPAPDPGLQDARLEVERSRLEAERASVEALRAELSEARTQLERSREELAEARAQVEQVRVELEQERVALDTARSALEPGGTPVSDVLEARGLKGGDEQLRALAALAAGRHLGGVLPDLRITDPVRLQRILDDRLVLVGGAVPEALQGVAAITVSPDRADLPDARELARLLDEVGEQMLLNGLRRLVVFNAAPRWHRLIREGLDRRVDLQFRAGISREAEAELTRLDAVVLWRVELGEDTRNAWQQAAGRLVGAPETSLAGFLTRVRDRLRNG